MAQDAKKDAKNPKAPKAEDPKPGDVASLTEPGTSDPKQPGERLSKDAKDSRS